MGPLPWPVHASSSVGSGRGRLWLHKVLMEWSRTALECHLALGRTLRKSRVSSNGSSHVGQCIGVTKGL